MISRMIIWMAPRSGIPLHEDLRDSKKNPLSNSESLNDFLEAAWEKRCRYLTPSTPSAQSFIVADTDYYFDLVVCDTPVTLSPRRSKHTERGSSSRQGVGKSIIHTDRFNNVIQRCYVTVSPIITVQLWKLLLIFRNESTILDIVEKLTDEVAGFMLYELDLLHGHH